MGSPHTQPLTLRVCVCMHMLYCNAYTSPYVLSNEHSLQQTTRGTVQSLSTGIIWYKRATGISRMLSAKRQRSRYAASQVTTVTASVYVYE